MNIEYSDPASVDILLESGTAAIWPHSPPFVVLGLCVWQDLSKAQNGVITIYVMLSC